MAIDMVRSVGAQCVAEFCDYWHAHSFDNFTGATAGLLASGNIFPEPECNFRWRIANAFSVADGILILGARRDIHPNLNQEAVWQTIFMTRTTRTLKLPASA